MSESTVYQLTVDTRVSSAKTRTAQQLIPAQTAKPLNPEEIAVCFKPLHFCVACHTANASTHADTLAHPAPQYRSARTWWSHLGLQWPGLTDTTNDPLLSNQIIFQSWRLTSNIFLLVLMDNSGDILMKWDLHPIITERQVSFHWPIKKKLKNKRIAS